MDAMLRDDVFLLLGREENVIAQHSIHRDAIIVILLIYVGY